MARLTVTHGPDAGKAIELPPGQPQLLGRSSEAIPSSDRCMSRRHAELTPELDGGWSIRDLASRYGTWVEGTRLTQPCRLVEGDRIRCGGTEFRYGAAPLLTPGAGGDKPMPDADEAIPALAHSIKNILQGLRGGTDTVELALLRGDLDLARRGWPLVARNLDRIYSLSLNLLALARPRPLDRTPVSLGELVRDASVLARGAAERRGVRLSVEVLQAPTDLWVDHAAMHHAVLNVLLNAVEAAPAKTGMVSVHVSAAAGEAIVAVIDDGPGIDPVIAPGLFEPFVSSKGQRGSGLGLAVTRRVVRAHGGEVEWEQSHTPGTRIVLRLPTGAPDGDPDETTGPASLDPAAVDEKFR